MGNWGLYASSDFNAVLRTLRYETRISGLRRNLHEHQKAKWQLLRYGQFGLRSTCIFEPFVSISPSWPKPFRLSPKRLPDLRLICRNCQPLVQWTYCNRQTCQRKLRWIAGLASCSLESSRGSWRLSWKKRLLEQQSHQTSWWFEVELVVEIGLGLVEVGVEVLVEVEVGNWIVEEVFGLVLVFWMFLVCHYFVVEVLRWKNVINFEYWK